MPKESPKRFMTWRDMVITPLIETVLLGLSYVTMALSAPAGATTLGKIVLLFLALVCWTFVALKVLRTFFPVPEGTYSYTADVRPCYLWNLYSFLCITNLSFQYISALLPPPFRKPFYQMMGAKFGKGIISIGGRITDPHLVTVEENVIIGDDALLLPHAIAALETDVLILAKIHLQKNSLVGAKAIILPGVTLGEGSMVTALSLVPRNTSIPPNEIWGGIPAVKIKDRTAGVRPEE